MAHSNKLSQIAQRGMAELDYGSRLFENCISNISYPEERVYLRFAAIADVFFTKEAPYSFFVRGVEQAADVINSYETVAIPPEFRSAFSDASTRFAFNFFDDADLDAKVAAINDALLKAPDSSPRYNLEKELGSLDEYQDIYERIKGESLTEGELQSALSKASAIMRANDIECPAFLLYEFSETILDLEANKQDQVSLDVYDTFFNLCDFTASHGVAIRALAYQATGPSERIGLLAAEHIITAVRRCEMDGKFSGSAAGFIAGVLYFSMEEESESERREIFRQTLPVLFHRLKKIDSVLFDAESIRQCLKDFHCEEDDDGGSSVDNTSPLLR